MLPFARMLEYGNIAPPPGFMGKFSVLSPNPGGYTVGAQNRSFSTSSGTKIYTIGGDVTSTGYSGELVEYDPVLNEYKLINTVPNTSLPSIPCYVNGYVYILYFPTSSGYPKLRRVNISTGINEELGDVPYANWTCGLVVSSDGLALYTINKSNYRLQRYDISTNKWDIQGSASFGTYTSDTILMNSDGYIFMLGSSFKRMDRFGSSVVTLSSPVSAAPFSPFYSTIFMVQGDTDSIYAYSYSILQRYKISTDKWEVISDGQPVVGALTTNAIGCYNPGTNAVYLFYAVVGPGAKGLTVGKIS